MLEELEKKKTTGSLQNLPSPASTGQSTFANTLCQHLHTKLPLLAKVAHNSYLLMGRGRVLMWRGDAAGLEVDWDESGGVFWGGGGMSRTETSLGLVKIHLIKSGT